MKAIHNYIHCLEDSKRLLDPLLRLLVQKKTIRREEAENGVNCSLHKVLETIQGQLISFVLLDTEPSFCRVVGLHLSPLLAPREKLENVENQYRNAILSVLNCIEKSAIERNERVISSGKSDCETCVSKTLKDCGCSTHSVIVVPVRDAKVPIGAFIAINRIGRDGAPGFFSDEDVELLEDVVFYCGKMMSRVLHPGSEVSECDIAKWIARYTHCEIAPVPLIACDELVTAIGIDELRQFGVVPLRRVNGNHLSVAIANPMNLEVLADFEARTDFHFAQRSVATPADICDALQRATPVTSKVMEEAERVSKQFDMLDVIAEKGLSAEENENSAVIIRIINRLIEDAHQNGASDIHIEPSESELVVRYRIDGVCRKKLSLPKAALSAVVARLKIMSDLDIAEHRVPQDGKIVFKKFHPGFDVDLRVSIAPMNYGESVVMRLLDKKRSTLPLNQLGFSNYNLELYHKVISTPFGMILHCGPTGSGKSMTLYAALNEINSPEWKILTVEDPIEYTLPGINQLQVKPSIGLTFPAALRCFLRQDPDIILVGEIRDKDTAEIAIEAALTGHLLFSTLHTNDACSSVTRLIEIGIEPFLIANTLVAICSQRLIRRLCTCKHPIAVTPEDRMRLECARDLPVPKAIFGSTGCDQCDHCGYKGRTGIHELLVLTDSLRDMVSQGAHTEALKIKARLDGMHTLFEDAMEKVAVGISSMTEAISVVREDESTFDMLPRRKNSEYKEPAIG